MRLHYFQHAGHEGLGTIEEWARKRDWKITKTLLYAGDTMPHLDAIDWLVVMGGPMSVNDEPTLPWLKQEKRFIASAIAQGKTVLGFCLGSQLIANALGATVRRNKYKEIGWFDVEMTESGLALKAFSRFPKRLKVFQWHGDTFDIPQKASLAATGETCRNQAVAFGERVIGIQFHLEVTQENVRQWILHGTDELTNEKYVQAAGEMLARKDDFDKIKASMYAMLDDLAG
jgi:GMP synthase-like glutamine amidotransferase